MFKFLTNYLTYHFDRPNYLFFLIIMSVMIFTPPVTMLFHRGELFVNTIFGMVVFIGAFDTSSNFREFVLMVIWGGIGFVLFVLNNNNYVSLSLVNAIILFSYFLFLLWKVVQYILSIQKVSQNAIYACVCGYMVLAISATPLFVMLNGLLEKAFLFENGVGIYDFIYFSFVTLTTLGYGDIVPLHPIAKSLSLLIGIAGQLYLTFIAAIIIGKYVVASKP